MTSLTDLFDEPVKNKKPPKATHLLPISKKMIASFIVFNILANGTFVLWLGNQLYGAFKINFKHDVIMPIIRNLPTRKEMNYNFEILRKENTAESQKTLLRIQGVGERLDDLNARLNNSSIF